MRRWLRWLGVGLFGVVFAVLGSGDVWAAPVKVGAGTTGGNTIVEISEVVTDIKCERVGGVYQLTLYGRNNKNLGTVKYNEPSSDAWCDAKIAAVKTNLKGATPSLWDDSGGSGTTGGGSDTSTTPSTSTGTSSTGECAAILTWLCEDGEGDIWGLLQLILDIMTARVGVLATIGMVVAGVQWLTARDKEDQIVKAKSRILNIVIGLVVWALMWLVLKWLLPGGIL